MKFGLEQHIIDKLIDVFEQHPKVDKALVFGSRAMGNYRPDSDIDIALKGQDLNTDDIIAMSVAFEENGITYNIDLINYHTIKEPDLKDHIDRVKIELYSRWKEVKLGDVVEINKKTIDKSYKHNVIEYLDTGSITQNKIEGFQIFNLEDAPSRAKRLVKQNDIIYSTVRPIQRHYGFIEDANENLVVSTGFAVISTIKEKADAKYLYFLLSSDDVVNYLDNIADGSTSAYPSLRPDDLAVLDITLPPLQEQTSIASILSSLDDKIDLLHRQNLTLEQLAETLFRQWFVEEAEESWEVGTLDDEFDFVMGQSPLGSDLNEDKIGTIFYQGRSDFGFRFPSPRVYTTAPTRLANPLDTLISVRAPVGDMNMAFEECCLGRGVAAFRFKSNPNFYSYTYYKLRSLMQSIKQFEDNGSVFGSIGKEDFKNLENIIPPQNFIEQFQKKAKPIDDKILLNEQQIRSLTQTRDTLLPKLMSGEVRVKI